MKYTRAYLSVAIFGFMLGIVSLVLGRVEFVASSWAIAIIFFVIFLFMRIFEMIVGYERKIPTEEDIMRVFDEHFIRKRKKRSLNKKGG